MDFELKTFSFAHQRFCVAPSPRSSTFFWDSSPSHFQSNLSPRFSAHACLVVIDVELVTNYNSNVWKRVSRNLKFFLHNNARNYVGKKCAEIPLVFRIVWSQIDSTQYISTFIVPLKWIEWFSIFQNKKLLKVIIHTYLNVINHNIYF